MNQALSTPQNALEKIEKLSQYTEVEKTIIKIILANKIRYGIMRRISGTALHREGAEMGDMRQVAESNQQYEIAEQAHRGAIVELAEKLGISSFRFSELERFVIDNESFW